jgi:MoxR-like ATPase
MNRALVTVDLTAVATPLANLVQRLRNAGLPFSDRRAVKMQRLVAASALLSGRTRALVSDLWVFRHVWDTLEQQEVLNALVQETLKQSPPDPQDHPRAAGSVPNAEDLARDLDDLHKRLGDAAIPPAERATLKDRLGLLAGRVQWVADDQQRAFLQQRVDALWTVAGGDGNGGGAA